MITPNPMRAVTTAASTGSTEPSGTRRAVEMGREVLGGVTFEAGPAAGAPALSSRRLEFEAPSGEGAGAPFGASLRGESAATSERSWLMACRYKRSGKWAQSLAMAGGGERAPQRTFIETSASRIEMIQKRTMILGSAQPFFS
jgi:hypothetical protein